MRARLTILGGLCVVALLAYAAASLAGPAGPLTLARDGATAVAGAGYIDSFPVNCGAAATAIQPSGGATVHLACYNSSTTKVAFGDSTIADPTDGQNSPIVCLTNCPTQEWQRDVKAAFCRADTGTVTVYCDAIVSLTAQP